MNLKRSFVLPENCRFGNGGLTVTHHVFAAQTGHSKHMANETVLFILQTAESAVVCGLFETTVTPIKVLKPVCITTVYTSAISVTTTISVSVTVSRVLPQYQ